MSDIPANVNSPLRTLTARITACVILLLCTAAVFARFIPRPPVVNAPLRRELDPAEISLAGNVVAFILDSPLDPAYVRRGPDIARRPASHGSMVARVLRNHANVPVVGLPAEDITGKRHREDVLDSLDLCLRFAEDNRQIRILLNISLAFSEHGHDMQHRIEELHRAGVLIVAAAGNDASEVPVYPAAYPQVVAVASSERNGKAPHSNYGGHIDISASGEASIEELAFIPYGSRQRIIETRGTSYAAPRVTAAVAYVLQKNPGWSTDQAMEFVRQSALPIEDALYEEGKLGAGYLDMAHVKSSVHRPYFWVHRFLPFLTFALLISLSALFVVRKRLVGLFIALLLWLGAVPAALLLFIALAGLLSAIKAGGQAGEWPYMIAALASAGGCMLYLKLRPCEMLHALAPPVAAGAVMGAAGVPPAVKGGAVIVLFPAMTALWEWKTRRDSENLEAAFLSAESNRERCSRLAHARGKYRAPRVRDKTVQLLQHIPPLLCACYLHMLIEEDSHSEGARKLLRELPEMEEIKGRQDRH